MFILEGKGTVTVKVNQVSSSLPLPPQAQSRQAWGQGCFLLRFREWGHFLTFLISVTLAAQWGCCAGLPLGLHQTIWV